MWRAFAGEVPFFRGFKSFGDLKAYRVQGFQDFRFSGFDSCPFCPALSCGDHKPLDRNP